MSWLLPLGMAGAGMLKNEILDKPKAEALAQAEAAKTFYSPWTGMHGQTVMPPSAMDAAMKWGLTGAMLQQQMGQGGEQGQLPFKKDEMMAYNNAKQPMSPWSQYGQGGQYNV